MKSLFVAPIVLLSILLASCTQIQIERQSSAYNNALFEGAHQQLLLNIVRASLDLPPVISTANSFTGSESISGSLAPSFPFGGDATRVFNLNPTINIKPGISSVAHVNVSQSKANILLTESITAAKFFRLEPTVGAASMITLSADRMWVHRELYEALAERFDRWCDQRRRHSGCRFIASSIAECSWEPRRIILDGDEEYVIATNRAKNRCEYLGFQILYVKTALFVVMGGDVSVAAKATLTKDGQVVRDVFGAPVAAVDKSVGFKFYIQNRVLRRKFASIRERLSRKAEKYKSGAPIVYSMRSPMQMLQFLGRLVVLHNAHGFNPVLPGRNSSVFFKVSRSRSLSTSDSGYSVTAFGPDGHTYYVKSPEYGASGKDRTLKVMTVVQELIDAAVAENPLSAPTTIIAR